MLDFDHSRLIAGNLEELKRFRKLLLEAEAGRTVQVSVSHDGDASCCRREPWDATFQRIQGALQPLVESELVNANTPPGGAL